jgi:thiamine monophosphate kinase
VPVYPASYAPAATTFDALVDELGEAADWVRVAGAEEPAPQDPFAALTSALGGAGVDLESLAGQLQGQDPNALMQQAMGLAQQLAESGQLGDVQRAMMDMMGGLGMDPQALLVESGVDVEAMREVLEDPSTLERLGLSPDQLEQLYQQTGGDPRAAMAQLGLSPEQIAEIAGQAGQPHTDRSEAEEGDDGSSSGGEP